MARMAPPVLEAYRRVANHHPDVEATRALFNATIQREVEVYRQLEDLRHKNKILMRHHFDHCHQEQAKYGKRALQIDHQVEKS